jgi:hypothetical protein
VPLDYDLRCLFENHPAYSATIWMRACGNQSTRLAAGSEGMIITEQEAWQGVSRCYFDCRSLLCPVV